MKKAGIGTVLAVFATVMLAAGADRNPEAQRLLKAATNAELVDGHVKGAITQYQKIVDVYGKTDRATAAEALVRMAECYQKLGDTQARSVYERVVREYADQKDSVALARTRIGVSEPARMTSRRIMSVPVGGIGYGSVSPDGRYFPYTNWDNGDLFLRDLVTGNNRRLTNISGLYAESSQFAVQSAFSRDGRQLAYGWVTGRHTEIRIIEASNAGTVQPRRAFSSEDVFNIWPDDWSPDGKWLAVQVRRQDKTAQIGLLAVEDGALRVLKSVDWRGATRLMFSPDGKYLAYDLPVSDADNQRDVFVLAVDGSREVGAVVHPANDVVMGWSADGSALLFSSDRTDAVGLWQVRVADGKPQGAPDLVKPQIEGAPLGVGKSGALYLLVHHPRFNAAVSADIRVAAFDFEAGRFLSPPVAPVQQFVGTNNFPAWSPDGKQIAYVSSREGATEPGAGGKNRNIIAIRSVETGQVRELRPALNLYPPVARWAVDGRSLLSHGRDNKGRQGLFRIDAESGAVSTIALSTDEGELRSPMESPDGRTIYYMRGYVGQPQKEFGVVERDVASGTEREVVRGRGILAPAFAPLLSPDGQSIVVFRDDPATRSTALLIAPAHGGQTKELIHVDAPRRVGFQSWTPDGRAILVTIGDVVQGVFPSSPGAATEVWWVPLDGSERRKLDVHVAGMTSFSVHPDGRQVAYGLMEPAKDDEVWVLENFLPRARTRP